MKMYNMFFIIFRRLSQRHGPVGTKSAFYIENPGFRSRSRYGLPSQLRQIRPSVLPTTIIPFHSL